MLHRGSAMWAIWFVPLLLLLVYDKLIKESARKEYAQDATSANVEQDATPANGPPDGSEASENLPAYQLSSTEIKHSPEPLNSGDPANEGDDQVATPANDPLGGPAASATPPAAQSTLEGLRMTQIPSPLDVSTNYDANPLATQSKPLAYQFSIIETASSTEARSLAEQLSSIESGKEFFIMEWGDYLGRRLKLQQIDLTVPGRPPNSKIGTIDLVLQSATTHRAHWANDWWITFTRSSQASENEEEWMVQSLWQSHAVESPELIIKGFSQTVIDIKREMVGLINIHGTEDGIKLSFPESAGWANNLADIPFKPSATP